MGFFDKKLHQLETGPNEESKNLAKATSDKASEIIKDLSGVTTAKTKRLVDNLVVFTNAAGGTGASTLLANVAYLAFSRKMKVVVVDLNIIRPIQNVLLESPHGTDDNDLVTYLMGRSELSKCIDSNFGVHIVSANNKTIIDEINCNMPIAIENYSSMLNMLRKYYDLVLVDCPMEIDKMLNNVTLYQADSIYNVWDEGLTSVINTEKLRRNLSITGVDTFVKMRVILNKRTSLHFTNYPLEKLNLELVETLPFDLDVYDCTRKGKLFCMSGATKAKNAIAFARKCDSLTTKVLKIAGLIVDEEEGNNSDIKSMEDIQRMRESREAANNQENLENLEDGVE